jgi:iron complex outermembrane receptor protein
LTAQGDAFQNTVAGGDIKGENILTRWESQHGSRSHFEAQVYYDRVRRDANSVLDSLQTFDLSAQQSISIGEHQEVVWGLGHRVTRDQFINNQNFFVLVPDEDTVRLSNLFAQDTISLDKSVALTIGSKFEYSSFSGFAALPSVRLAWQARYDAMFWTAVSRAVRTPSRIDRELTAPGFLDAADDFKSETVIAYEAGYRGQLSQDFSWSMSLYYNDYDRLRMVVQTPNGHFRIDNAMRGSTSGVEAWGDYQINNRWRLSAGLNLIAKDLRLAPNALTPVLTQHAGNDPHHQYFLRTSLDLPHDLELDLDFRAVGGLSTPEVPSYNELGARLGWRISKQLNISLVGFNLLDSQHPETGLAGARSEIRRSAQLGITWRMR